MSLPFFEAAALLAMVYGGILAGLIYDACSILRMTFCVRLINSIVDVIFVVLSASIFLMALFIASDGAFRPYLAVGFLCGFLIEHISLSFYVKKIAVVFIRFLSPSKS